MKNARLAAGSWQPAADHGWRAPSPAAFARCASRSLTSRARSPSSSWPRSCAGGRVVLVRLHAGGPRLVPARDDPRDRHPRLHQPHAVLRGGAAAHPARAVGVHRPRQVQGAAAGHRGGRGAEGRDHLDLDSPLQLQRGPAGHPLRHHRCRVGPVRPVQRREGALGEPQPGVPRGVRPRERRHRRARPRHLLRAVLERDGAPGHRLRAQSSSARSSRRSSRAMPGRLSLAAALQRRSRRATSSRSTS